ncbi:hypothetical protein BKA93DRAFT_190558 [Sparassis latifolia]
MVVEADHLEQTDEKQTSTGEVIQTSRGGSNLRFPAELFHSIFSHILHGNLAEESPKKALENLTLTCKVFYHLAQPLLFDSCTFPISRTWKPPPEEGVIYPSHADPIPMNIIPLSVQESEDTLHKLCFIGQERIATAVRHCRLAPIAYPEYSTPVDDHCQEDAHEHTIVDRFFHDIIPKLSNLRILELVHVTLGPSHLRLLHGVCVQLHSLCSETCFLQDDDEMRLEDHNHFGAMLSVKNLICKRTIHPGNRKMYLPLPHPTHVESLSYHFFSFRRRGLSHSMEGRERVLFRQLTAMGKFTSLRSLDVTIRPYGAVCDWRQFISTHCCLIESLSMQRHTKVNISFVAPRDLPSLKLFRGMWDDVRFYALQQGGLRHLIVTGKRADAPEDGLRNHPILRHSDVLAGLNGRRDEFACLESLELKIWNASEKIIAPIFNCCPRLRALKLIGNTSFGVGLSSLSSVFIAVTLCPDIEYLSLPQFHIELGQRASLESMISSSSVHLRTQCPKLHYVHFELREEMPMTKGSRSPVMKNSDVRFDPTDDRILTVEHTIEDWRSRVWNE